MTITRTRRAAAVLLSAALGLAMAVSPGQQATAAPPTDGLALHYPLQTDTGTVVTDASGNDRHGTLVGGGAAEGDAGLRFTGTNYVTMPDDLITGLSAVSVSVEVLVDPTLSANSNYFFYNLGNRIDPGAAQSDQHGYLFASDSANLLKARISDQRWEREQDARRAGSLPRAEWHNVTFTFDGPTIVLYLDGEEVGRRSDATLLPSDIGLDPAGETNYNALARSAYINDVMFKGRLRDFRLYTRALTASEVGEINAFNARDSLDADVAALNLGDTSQIDSDLTLPQKGQFGASISWSSSDPAVVSESGEVTPPAEVPASVSLTATLVGRDGVSATKAFAVTVLPQLSAQERAQRALADIVVHNADDARGNLTLPTIAGAEDTPISWSSSAPAVVSDTGEVTRGADDASVVLTATATVNGATATKEFVISVPAAAAPLDYEGYLFTYFVGEGTANGEQIYFGLSEGNDPLHYMDLADNQPVLTSTLGEEGLRDPFIIRSPEGDKFYQIATDLRIYDGRGWDAAQRSGSKSIMVWESTDLVNWTDQRLVQVSPDTAGNTWAPEAFYDESIGAYVVFWASKLYAEDDPDHTGNTYNRMMYATTRDFHTFTPAQVWIDPGYSVIDSTVIKEGDTYYRFTKDERGRNAENPCGKYIVGESSTELRSTDWTFIDECIGQGQINAGEGPTIFKDNEADKWYMFIDEFGGRGYVPFETTNLDGDRTEWTIPDSYDMPSRPRHGTVLPITQEEWSRVLEHHQPDAAVVEIEPFAQTVQVGQAPILPGVVSVQYADGSSGMAAVTWDPVPAASYAAAGSFTVEGRVPIAPGLRATAAITVQTGPVKAESLTVDPASVIVKPGNTRTVSVSILPATTADTTVTWTSADPRIARVAADGTITALTVGTTTVTASVAGADGPVSADVTVVVATDITDGLVLRYEFEGDDESVIDDVSGHDNDGAVTAGAPRVPGVNGEALSLSGTTRNYVTLPAGLLGSDALTVTTYLNWAGGSTDPWTFTLGSGQLRHLFHAASHWSGGSAAGVTLNEWRAEERATASADLSSNQWHHVAVSLGGGQLSYYVDGALVGSVATETTPADIDDPTDLISGYIGRSMYAADPYFTGLVDDFRVYDRALSAPEVATLVEQEQEIYIGGTVTATITQATESDPATLTLSGQADGTTVEYRLPGGEWETYSGPVELAEGSYLVQWRATGSNGVVSEVWEEMVSVDASPTPTPTPTPSPTPTPEPPLHVDVYSTPGFHNVNGRMWYTECEPYSQTTRCRTEIWSTTVHRVDGRFVQVTGWHFNNLTYLPRMTREQWSANPLGVPGEWTSQGRSWRTECDTPATGQNGCRSYIWTSYVGSTLASDGRWVHSVKEGWVFNNIVRFRATG
ncbi:LamG-like jellyroll fold domain-containing protein [Tessaracoccus flavus]|uniref:Uncharacterized protein n=1 Tax=Tessaracoccus flavus TaxID=1610493 RepID=A0A1Q2CBY8_9ACTN|nr:LamG-like jellyroll fold domain-containing protein [Tessaracoccus flavus]AQP43624.1 hypothetical protein RPIT_01325 [Tessaracoccus flavus]SDZ01146.1 Glycosyl hydrolases family 43 [Tessaracoccus flavus]